MSEHSGNGINKCIMREHIEHAHTLVQAGKIHSYIEKATLNEDHPLAYEGISCAICGCMCHSDDNKCMKTWIEMGKGNYCFCCFTDSGEKEGIKEGGKIINNVYWIIEKEKVDE